VCPRVYDLAASGLGSALRHGMESIKLLLQIYTRPGFAFSEVMDRGNWLVAAGLTLLIAVPFFGTINTKLDAAYRIPTAAEYIDPAIYESDPESAAFEAQQRRSMEAYQSALAARKTVPVVGDTFFRFFSFNPAAFYQPLLALSVFYVPAVILLVSLFAGIGSFGLLLRRDYAVLATCALMAWAAAHLPFAPAGLALFNSEFDPAIYFGLWIASGALFGVFMLFAIRTVFGTSYAVAAAVVAVAWPSISLSMYVFQYISPWLLSPFILFYAFIYFGGYLGGEVRGFGNAFRRRQNLKRFLQNATVNPKDADAHVQLGLIYLERKQETRAIEHFKKAIEIDKIEIDANYELGRIARQHGKLQEALDHFEIVLEQDDKYRLSEVWREVGATYLAAGMLKEASEALEKFVDRRAVDPEGLYYLGRVLKANGERDRARELFEQAIQAAKTSPYFRSRQLGQWSKLAQKEL
jgi:tetratricopeptide (TPR) repeat protein